jgi:hypothetical protein
VKKAAAACFIFLFSFSALRAQTGETFVSEDFRPFEEVCRPVHRWYAGVDFLWWYLRQDDTPPLVTTGPVGTTGRIGDPGVSVVYGGNLRSRHDRFIGVRPTLGYWFDDQHDLGVEASAFFLERDSSVFSIKNSTLPLFRPYIRADDGQPDAEQFAGLMPNGIMRLGSVNVYGRKEVFGEDLRFLKQLTESTDCHCYAVVGAKFLQFRNRLNIVATGYDEPALNVLYGVEDDIFTYDRFYGGQLGVRVEYESGCWTLQSTVSTGLGGNEERIRAYGSRLVQTPVSIDQRPVGLYVLRTNTGDSSHWVFDAVPEFTLNLSWSPCDWVRVKAGYTLILWLNTIRAGNQIDTTLNTNQILTENFTGPGRPEIPWRERLFWIQGINVGLEFSW